MMLNPDTETQRLADLENICILKTPPEAEYDDIVLTAAAVFDVPIALISLVGSDFQWFKAKTGLEASETGRNVSFCSHAIAQDNIYIVENALDNALFQENPLVTGDPNIRFYAGAPLALPGGSRIGTLCIIDRKPRTLDQSQELLLMTLSKLVVRMLVSRKTAVVNHANNTQEQSSRLISLAGQMQAENNHYKIAGYTRSLVNEMIAIKDGKFTRKSLGAFCDQATIKLKEIDVLSAAVAVPRLIQESASGKTSFSLFETVSAAIAMKQADALFNITIHNDIDTGIVLSPGIAWIIQLLIENLLDGLASLEQTDTELELFADENTGHLQLSFLLSGFDNEMLNTLLTPVTTTPEAAAETTHYLFTQHLNFVMHCIRSCDGKLSVNQLSKKRMSFMVSFPKKNTTRVN